MKSTEYLYDINPRELENKMYFEALQYKYDAATKLYGKLFKLHDKTQVMTDRMHHVWRAQEHTKKLLEERG